MFDNYLPRSVTSRRGLSRTTDCLGFAEPNLGELMRDPLTLAVMAADSSCGRLEARGGLARLLSQALSTAARMKSSEEASGDWPRPWNGFARCASR